MIRPFSESDFLNNFQIERPDTRRPDADFKRASEHKQVILKSETYNFHRLDLMRQVGFIVTVYDEDGLKLAATNSFPTFTEAFTEVRKIVDNKIDSPKLQRYEPTEFYSTSSSSRAWSGLYF